MFVVYISAAAVGLLEVVTTTVAVLELCTHSIKTHMRISFDYHFVMYVHRATAVRERLHFNGHDGGVLAKRNELEW